MPGSLSTMADKVKKRIGGSSSKGEPEPNSVYLTYHDVTLKYIDMDSIPGEGLLTDAVISFWEEFIEREELINYPKARVILMRPDVAHMLRETPDGDPYMRANMPNTANVTHIFVPVNDDRAAEYDRSAGHYISGTHWSLLLCSVIDGVCFHYDSARGLNATVAQRTANRLAAVLQKPLRFVPMRDFPTQNNGADCGLFVCLAMRHLLIKRLLRADATEKVSMSMRNQHIDAGEGRQIILRLIEERRAEAIEIQRRAQSATPSKADADQGPPRISALTDKLWHKS